MHLLGSCQSGKNKSTEKVRPVSAHSFLWVTDGVNVRLRLWGYVEEGVLGMSVHICVCVRGGGGGELFVNAWKLCVPFKCRRVAA